MARLSDDLAQPPLPGSAGRSAGPAWGPLFVVLSFMLLLLALPAGCGGSQKATPGSPDAASEHPSSDADGFEGGGAERPPQHCADGSCFTCGDGLCPLGFYCDEGAVGGPACSWTPACPKEPDCACLTDELGSGCRCDQRGDGLYVDCE